MRIRRRPPGAQPLAYLLPTDPYPPPPPEGKQQGEGEGELHLHPASATNDSAADLGDARSSSSSPLGRPALPMPPQDDGAVEERSRGGSLLGAQQQLQQGPADGRTSSLENGLHLHVPEPETNPAGELLSNNGVGAAVAVTTPATTGAKATKKQKQETKDTSGGGGDGAKRAPRGPGTLLEGSRCSRKNGRGWRCSQPTLVGYALCQYHLGKGRMKRDGSAATVGRGPGQLGRTEHANKKTPSAGGAAAAVAPATAGRPKVAAKKTSAAAVAPAIATAPKVDVPPPPPPPLPSVQQC